MLSIKKTLVPAYLRVSNFYRSLSEEGDQEFTVSESNMKQDTNVNTATDLVHILFTARFWGLDELPGSALHFAMFVCDENTFQQIEEFEDSAKTVECLKAIRSAEGNQKIHRAIEFGRIDFIRYLLTTGLVLTLSDGVYAASKHQLTSLAFITSKLEEKTSSPYHHMKLYDLPTSVDGDCLKHLHFHGAKLDKSCVVAAASVGNLPCLQYLHQRVSPVNKQAMAAAARFGHLDCVKFIYEVGKIYPERDHAAAAASNGHLECLKYLLRGLSKSIKISTSAAEGGHLDCLRYAHERGCPMGKAAMERVSNLDCIKYMREKKVKWDHGVYRLALLENRLDSLQYFHSNGLPCNGANISHNAACTESGESLRFLYQHGAAVQTSSVKEYMLPYDNLNCLKLAVQFGYKPTAHDCEIAVECNALRCIEFLHKCGCPWATNAAKTAARRGNLPMLTLLHESGCPCDATTTAAAAAHYNIQCLKYLHEHNVPWDESTCTTAVNARILANLKYAHENGCAWDHHTYEAARGWTDCVDYLELQGCPKTAEETAALQAQKNAAVGLELEGSSSASETEAAAVDVEAAGAGPKGEEPVLKKQKLL